MRKLLLAGAAAVIATSACIKIDNSLGKGLVDKSLLYDTYTEEFPLENITMKRAEDLSGYSSTRVVVGSIRDDYFGLTTRESAFTLVPALDTVKLGTNPKAVSLDLYFASDSVSCADDSQARILQNIYVSELSAALDGVTELIFDMSNLQYISSAGLRVLLSAQKKMNRQGSMVVRHSNADIMDIFDVTGFTDILTLED